MASCTKSPEDTQFVARVGDAVLTREEMTAMVGAQPPQLVRQFVSDWVTSQMLYQEARRKGFAETDDLARQLEDARKQLAINAFLDKELQNGNEAVADEATIAREFASNREAYKLREDVVKISFVMFEERDDANAFRFKVLQGTSWEQALHEVQADSVAREGLLRVATNEYFTQAMLYPEELWKIAQALSKEDVSYVVKTDAGYCVVVVHGAQRQGEVPELDFARNEIIERLTIARRNVQYNALLAKLRSQYSVEVRFDTPAAQEEVKE